MNGQLSEIRENGWIERIEDPADPQRTWPVGQLKPNGLGLFDVYGNVWEWGHDRAREYAAGTFRLDIEDRVLGVRDGVARTRRGGSFPCGAYTMRSAHRGAPSQEVALRRAHGVAESVLPCRQGWINRPTGGAEATGQSGFVIEKTPE